MKKVKWHKKGEDPVGIRHYLVLYFSLGTGIFSSIMLSFFIGAWTIILIASLVVWLIGFHTWNPRKCSECGSKTKPIKESEIFFGLPSKHTCSNCNNTFKVDFDYLSGG